jgi:plasmid stabilization system protein ParE
MTFEVRLSVEAQDDLARLFDFLLTRAKTLEDLDQAQAAIDSLRTAVTQQLAITPYSFRKAGTSSTRRELIVPYGNAGFVALYEIVSPSWVLILAIRHQREEDYH